MLEHDARIWEGLEGSLQRLRAFQGMMGQGLPERALWRPLRELEDWLHATAVDLYRETRSSAVMARPTRTTLAERLATAVDRARLLVRGDWRSGQIAQDLERAREAIEIALTVYGEAFPHEERGQCAT